MSLGLVGAARSVVIVCLTAATGSIALAQGGAEVKGNWKEGIQETLPHPHGKLIYNPWATYNVPMNTIPGVRIDAMASPYGPRKYEDFYAAPRHEPAKWPPFRTAGLRVPKGHLGFWNVEEHAVVFYFKNGSVEEAVTLDRDEIVTIKCGDCKGPFEAAIKSGGKTKIHAPKEQSLSMIKLESGSWQIVEITK